MSLAPLLEAPFAVVLHTFMAISAFFLGLVQFALLKGTRRHRLLGWIWVILLMSVATSVFFISTMDGKWSAKFLIVHVLTVCTLIVVPLAVFYARRHRVRAHATWMVIIFTGALILAGSTAFLPGRIMHEVVFGPALAK